MPLSLASTVGRFIIQRRDDLDLKSKIGVEIYVLKLINIEVVCPMQQKTIPVENNENVRMNNPFRQSSASSTFYGN